MESDGGSPIQYCIIYQDGITNYQTPDGSADSYTVTGLKNGQTYSFSVLPIMRQATVPTIAL